MTHYDLPQQDPGDWHAPLRLPPRKTGSSSLGSGEVRWSGRELDFAVLRRQIRIVDVLELLQWRPVSVRGVQLRGPCPIHEDASSQHSRVFSVQLERQVWRCFRPGCGHGNALDLWILASQQPPLYRSALELCRKLGIEPPYKTDRTYSPSSRK